MSEAVAGARRVGGTVFGVLGAVSFCHLLNDMMQSLLPALYPVLKASYGLSFVQVGLLTLANQMTASVLQPVVGLHTDRRPLPFSLPAGMVFTLCGLFTLSGAASFPALLAAVALVGVGSSVFHPEGSRVARLASGGRHGLAQALLQVGGNAGAALGPLLAAFVVVPNGQRAVAWFGVAALLGIVVLTGVGQWYRRHAVRRARREAPPNGLSRRAVGRAIAVLIVLIFSKYFYLASIGSYYTFYLISRFHLSVRSAQMHLFLFLGAAALGTIIGGPLGDRIGRKRVIWGSILGVLPFTLALPYVGLGATAVLTVVIGLVLSSAFSAIVVYAQELMPHRLGMISGLFYGMAFGFGGVGAAVLGQVADWQGITFVYQICAFLPAIGLLAIFLPHIKRHKL
jgi:FSR family fosmidomycin resistance protein-like MFS transporter